MREELGEQQCDVGARRHDERRLAVRTFRWVVGDSEGKGESKGDDEGKGEGDGEGKGEGDGEGKGEGDG